MSDLRTEMNEESDFNKNAAIIIQHIVAGGSLPGRAYRQAALDQLQKYIAFSEPQQWHSEAHEKAVILSDWLRKKKRAH